MKSAIDKTLDLHLWRACAGRTVRVPAENSAVFYFPQGHAENASCSADFAAATLGLPPLLLCRVQGVTLSADADSDEVFATITLLPIPAGGGEYPEEEDDDDDDGGEDSGASFAKVLTQSDANNGGGFSVPRHCADTVFPALNFAADPPVQDLFARDVHGDEWKFRHIYRGTPRRHLLTSGWSVFVNKKRLVAKDSIVFVRDGYGNIRVGIRRARRAAGNGKARPEEFAEAVRLAARGEAFKVVYYPRDGAAEFCVRALAVKAACMEQWCPGLRMKMAVEDETTSRIRACNGSISKVQAIDPFLWPTSPWRVLVVSWEDDPDNQQNPERVCPWMVEVVSGMSMYPTFPSFAQPRKKSRLEHPNYTLDGQFPVPPPILGNNTALGSSDPLGYLSNTNPAGIQGARHLVFEVPLPELELNKQLRMGMFPSSTPELNQRSSVPKSVETAQLHENRSLAYWVAVEQTSPNLVRSGGPKKNQFSLFGAVIDQELTPSRVANQQDLNGRSSSEESEGRDQSDSDGSEGTHVAADYEIDHPGRRCKIFKEFMDVGRSIDLTVVGSYDALYKYLAGVFQMEISSMKTRVLYHDETGAPKKTGDQPFSDFMKRAKRLTITTDPQLNNDIGRARS